MGCLSSKKSNNKSLSNPKSPKKHKETDYTRNTETYPEEVLEDLVYPLRKPELQSSSCSRSNSIVLQDDSSKVYSFAYLQTETFLIEYNTATHTLDKIGLGFHLFPESGCVQLHSGPIMCAGGIDLACHKEIKNVFMINPALQEIFEVSEMQFVKRKLRLLQVCEYVYAIGGVKELNIRTGNFCMLKQDYGNSFSRYSLKRNEWEMMEDLPQGVESPGCFYMNQKVYVSGGCFIQDFMVVIEDFQVYDVEMARWEIIELKLPKRIYGHLCATTEDDVIIIFGGINEEMESNYQSWVLGKSGISELNVLPQDNEMFLPFYPNVNKDEVFSFNEENELVLFNLKLSSWTVSNLLMSRASIEMKSLHS